ncbi:MAG: signal peptide peptidase SppA [Bdellovibrio sp.]|nr:MAG: signal peptide peptidase SppA [Bdellovibrio sp.]
MLGVLFLVFGGIWVALIVFSSFSLFSEKPNFHLMGRPAILKLELNGIILDGKKLVKPLIKYRDEKFIKAVVVEVNSPGGVVGPSQEIFEELRRVRENLEKPVVVVSNGLMASGAYYAAVAADKIMVQPGTLVGSIGVVMQFTNLEKLYDWAKVSRYSITTGKFKDSGAEYRAMRPDERDLFQKLINDVYVQFVDAVATSRNLKPEMVRQYADGRVLTGQQAKDLGFVDEIGTVQDAYDLAAQMAGYDPKEIDVFEPPKKGIHWLDLLARSEDDEGETSSWDGRINLKGVVDHALDRMLKLHLLNQPLYLMPGEFK